jgi:DNA processing protein
MTPMRYLTLLDPDYPTRLRDSPYAPACLATRGGALEADVVVAIVGSRRARAAALRFTTRVSASLVRAGAVVVSGGARGIDGAAHRGAIAAGGRTWVVAATGPEGCFPAEHAPLFERVAEGPGAMLWPFGAKKGRRSWRSAFPARNRILVTLADAVVVMQAGAASGALNAASWAVRLGKPLWVAPAAPWMRDFDGSHQLLREGARPLESRRELLRGLGLAPAHDRLRLPAPPPPLLLPPAPTPAAPQLSLVESKVLGALSAAPLHLDGVTIKSHLSAQETAAALLTLALENVVVEGPPGFYRRRNDI